MLVLYLYPSASVHHNCEKTPNNMKITTLLVLACLIAVCMARPKPRPADQEYDYEEEAAPVKKVAAKPNPLLRRSPLNRGGPKTTTTTTTQAPLEDEEEIEEGEIEEDIAESTTTTEAPKKLRGGVRPFRSNDDLLAALKRRREQASNGKAHAAKTHENTDQDQARDEPTAAPKRGNNQASRPRNRFQATPKKEQEQEQEAESAPAAVPSRTGRRFSSRA